MSNDTKHIYLNDLMRERDNKKIQGEDILLSQREQECLFYLLKGKSAQKEVEKEMRRYNKGTAKSGSKGKKVTSREQAIAIGLSKARKKGAKVPKKAS